MADRNVIDVLTERFKKQQRGKRTEDAFRANYEGPIATSAQPTRPEAIGNYFGDFLQSLGLGATGANEMNRRTTKGAGLSGILTGMDALDRGDFGGAAEQLVGGPAGGALESMFMAPAKNLERDALTAIAAPAVHTGGNQSLIDKIYKHAEEQRTPKYPMAKEPVFDTSGDVTARTHALVPQQSVREQLPQRPDLSGDLPKGGRIRQIAGSEQEIGNLLAQDLSRAKDGGALPFYATGPVIEGLADKGELGVEGANRFMRDWSGFGAATSPRTKTPPNLRNASYLMFRDAQGDPLTSAKRAEEGNRPGFPMMGMHTELADEFSRGVADPLKNSKPFTFRENWSGNMEDVTADTHNIRKVLDAYDRLNPGGLQKDWFTDPAAFERYKAAGGFPKEGELPVGDIADALGTQQIGGRKTQTEYPLMQRPTEIAAEKLGIQPAQAQERLWFEGGPRTGLKSPAMTIPDLLNAQIEATARATGLSPDVILKLWSQRQIPLASNEQPADGQGTSQFA